MLDATSSQVDPRNTARPPAAPRIGPGPAIEAAVVVAAIDGEARRDAVHPAQAALGVAVGLGAAGGLAEQGSGARLVLLGATPKR
jgi:hypothetical protein